MLLYKLWIVDAVFRGPIDIKYAVEKLPAASTLALVGPEWGREFYVRQKKTELLICVRTAC
jgi:hypothetical protein